MAGFRKAKPAQKFDKRSIYGPPGSGKTFTALLMAEGYGRRSQKLTAYVDTEHGTDFYAQAVPERRVHPEAFEFEALYTRSVTEILQAVRSLDPEQYGQVVIDSMTHVWEATKAAYRGPTDRHGKPPIHAWGKIKKPYKDLMEWALNSPFHVFLLGREGVEMQEDPDSGEAVFGKKMKAESETAYEPHIAMRMFKYMNAQDKALCGKVAAFVEKDRTGVLDGQTIVEPSFETVCEPIVHLLGAEAQAQVMTAEESTLTDQDALDEQDRSKAKRSAEIRDGVVGKFLIARSESEVAAVAKDLTTAIKAEMLRADIDACRAAWEQAMDRVRGK